MNVVAHNLSAMNANRQFHIIDKGKRKSTEKLASGYRINRSSDDAAGLAISEKMRRQIRGLSQGINNTQDGISLCQVADGALSEVSDMLHRITELSVKAANGSCTPDDREAIQQEIGQLLTEIDRIGETTEFNSLKLFDGSCMPTDYSKSTPNSISQADALQQLTDASYPQAAVDIIYQGVTYDKDAINAYLAAQSSSVICWGLEYNNVKYDGPNGNNTQKIVDSLKRAAENDLVLYDGLLECGRINETQFTEMSRISNKILEEADSLVGMSSSRVYSLLSVYKSDASNRPYPNFTSDIASDFMYQIQEYARGNTVPSFSNGQTPWLWNMKHVYFHFPDDFASGAIQSSVITQNEVISDYQKIQNLIKGYTPDGRVNEEMRKMGLWIQSGSEPGQGMYLGVDAINTNILGIGNLNTSTQSGAQRALQATHKALEAVSASRSKIGAQQNRLEHTISNEQNVVENTTSSESHIRDTDMAKEMVNFSKATLLENVGQTMLAQANQRSQTVLSLLG